MAERLTQSPSPTGAGVEALRRLSSPGIGADREHPGRFAVYFYDAGQEVAVFGGYESASLAASAVDWIRADAVVKAEGPVRSASGQAMSVWVEIPHTTAEAFLGRLGERARGDGQKNVRWRLERALEIMERV